MEDVFGIYFDMTTCSCEDISRKQLFQSLCAGHCPGEQALLQRLTVSHHLQSNAFSCL